MRGIPRILATDNDHEGELIAYEPPLAARHALKSPCYMHMRFNTVAATSSQPGRDIIAASTAGLG